MRWEQKGGGCFQSERFSAFHRDVSRILSQMGWLRLDFLILNGEKIAGIYGFFYGRRYSFYLPGLNPGISPEASPGLLLLFDRIQRAIQEECQEFDLLQGTAHYKLAWADSMKRLLTLTLYNKNLRASVLKMVESGKAAVKILAR